MITKELIEKINILANKKKTVGLTEEETKQQQELRKEYLREFKKNFIHQLEGIEIVDE